MNRTSHTLCVLGMVACLVACGADQPEGEGQPDLQDPTVTTWEQPPLPEAAGGDNLDQTNPDAVAQQMVRTFFGWDPATDSDSADAALRAAPLMDEELAASHAQSWSGMTRLPGRMFQQWKQDNATVEVQLVEHREQRPPDEPRHVRRGYTVHVLVSTGDRVDYDVHTELSELGWWRVDAFQVTGPRFSHDLQHPEITSQ